MDNEKTDLQANTEQENKKTHETETPEQDAPDATSLLAEKQEEIRSYIDRLKRLQADFENYKKRMIREMASLEEWISNREILDFLPLYDNLQRAFANFSGNNDSRSFVEGVEQIYAQFDQILKQKGMTPIEALDKEFDPAKHEALLSVPSDKPQNVILEEIERGYMRNGQVLRPSKVKVSKGKIQAEKEKT